MAKTWFQSVLEDRIATLIQQRSSELSHGSAEDYSSYKFQVGFIHGLEAAVGLADEINREMDK